MTKRSCVMRALAAGVAAGATLVSFSGAAAAPVYSVATDHYYERVDVGTPQGITWPQADGQAQSKSHYGLTGYLATITTQSENDFVTSNLGGAALGSHWLGGTKSNGSVTWSWSTGEALSFINWYNGQVDTSLDTALGMIFSWYGDIRPAAVGKWQSVQQVTPGLVPGQPGYVVEYGTDSSVGPFQNPSNGHYYERVQVADGGTVSFAVAKVMAGGMTHNGLKGHLVAINSQDENDFIVNNLGGAMNCSRWLGAENTNGTWQWVTGEPWSYGNWQSGAPVGSAVNPLGMLYDTTGRTNEAALGTWNGDSNSGVATRGFIVEYEAAYRPTSIDIPSATAFVGGWVYLKAHLAAANGDVPGRLVAFSVEGSDLGTATTDGSGIATAFVRLPASLGSGAKQVTVTYDGTSDIEYLSCIKSSTSLTVSKASTKLSPYMAISNPGKSLELKAILFTGSQRVPGRTINFAIDGTPVGSGVTDASGVARYTYSVPMSMAFGDHNLTVSFDGSSDADFNSSSRTAAVIRLDKLVSAISFYAVSGTAGSTVNVRCILFGAGAIRVAGRTVSFSVEGNPIGSAVTNASGVASVPFTIPAGWSAGSYSITGTFDGGADSTYHSTTRTQSMLTVK